VYNVYIFKNVSAPDIGRCHWGGKIINEGDMKKGENVKEIGKIKGKL
jgi:hypothetical protein